MSSLAQKMTEMKKRSVLGGCLTCSPIEEKSDYGETLVSARIPSHLCQQHIQEKKIMKALLLGFKW